MGKSLSVSNGYENALTADRIERAFYAISLPSKFLLKDEFDPSQLSIRDQYASHSFIPPNVFAFPGEALRWRRGTR